MSDLWSPWRPVNSVRLLDKVEVLLDPPHRRGSLKVLVLFVMSEEEEEVVDVGEGVLMGEEITPESAHSSANTRSDVCLDLV